MNFTDQLWDRIIPIYEAILELPFILKLTSGTLPQQTFLFYLKQDTLYLADFSRALSIAAIQCEDTGHMYNFLNFASEAVVVERQLHENYYEQYGAEMNPQKTPACFSYTNFLLSTAATKHNAISIAAILPCFWIYREVGMKIYEQASKDNPYKDWIETYAGDEFNESVNRAIAITEEIAEKESAERHEKMTQAFVKSTELEWMFWDSAYRQEQWPLGQMQEEGTETPLNN